MTILEYMQNNKIAISPNNYDDFVDTMRVLEDAGFTWRNGKKFSEEVLTRNCDGNTGWNSVWENEDSIPRYSTNGSYYILVDGNKLSKKNYSFIRGTDYRAVSISDIIKELDLDVDEDGFEKEFL